jgi:hypothetical protein
MAYQLKFSSGLVFFFLWIFLGTFLGVSAACIDTCIDTLVCESTSGSPSTSDAEGLVSAIRGYDPRRCQGTSGVGSKCTTFAKSGSAAAAMCKGVKSFSCVSAADALHAINLSCANNYHSGGKCNIKSDDGTVISIQLIHS